MGSAAVFVVALLMQIGWGGSGEPAQSLHPASARPTVGTADKVVERAVHLKPSCKRSGRSRFYCELGDLNGAAMVELTKVRDGFVIRGCGPGATVCKFLNPRDPHRTVAQEKPAERRAAGMLDTGFGNLEHATCARSGRGRFACAGIFRAEGMHDAVTVDLEIVRREFHFVRGCRTTKFWRGVVPLACQRMDWDINFRRARSWK